MYGFVPMRLENRRLFVAMSDPTHIHVLDDLSETSGYAVVPVMASVEDIKHTQSQLFGVGAYITETMEPGAASNTDQDH